MKAQMAQERAIEIAPMAKAEALPL